MPENDNPALQHVIDSAQHMAYEALENPKVNIHDLKATILVMQIALTAVNGELDRKNVLLRALTNS